MVVWVNYWNSFYWTKALQTLQRTQVRFVVCASGDSFTGLLLILSNGLMLQSLSLLNSYRFGFLLRLRFLLFDLLVFYLKSEEIVLYLTRWCLIALIFCLISCKDCCYIRAFVKAFCFWTPLKYTIFWTVFGRSAYTSSSMRPDLGSKFEADLMN